MYKKKILILFWIFFFLITIIICLKLYRNTDLSKKNADEQISEKSNSNTIFNVEYYAKDAENNEFIIKAKEGEIDLNDSSIIFLKNVNAVIKLNEKEKILISADFGKYNNNNFDTIFSKNVLINYSEKKIKSEYLDFSILRNSMIISKNVIYTDAENILKTDVVEINMKSKDFKFFMFDKQKKVQLINKNWHGDYQAI